MHACFVPSQGQCLIGCTVLGVSCCVIGTLGRLAGGCMRLLANVAFCLAGIGRMKVRLCTYVHDHEPFQLQEYTAYYILYITYL